MELPVWMDLTQWNEYKAYRQEMKKPLGPIAERKAIAALERAFRTPEERKARIDMAMANGWQGLVFQNDYPKPKSNGPALCQRCKTKPVTTRFHMQWCSNDCMMADHR